MSRVKSRGPCPSCRSNGKDRKGDNLIKYEDGHSYCFSCRYQEGGMSAERALKRLETSFLDSSVPYEYPTLPNDCEPYLPALPMEWLAKYGITSLDVVKNRLMYSEEKKLLIFPFFGEDNNELMAWQGRYFGQNPHHPKWYTKGDVGNVIAIFDDRQRQDLGLVLVEDIISAIKVGRSFACSPIFGSFLDTTRLLRLRMLTGNLILWLDPDKRKESIKFANLANKLGFQTRILLSDDDPKTYNDSTIEELVGNSIKFF